MKKNVYYNRLRLLRNILRKFCWQAKARLRQSIKNETSRRIRGFLLGLAEERLAEERLAEERLAEERLAEEKMRVGFTRVFSLSVFGMNNVVDNRFIIYIKITSYAIHTG